MEHKMGCDPCHKYRLHMEGRRKTPYDNCIRAPAYLLIRILIVVNCDSAFARPIDGNGNWAYDVTTANQVGSEALRIL